MIGDSGGNQNGQKAVSELLNKESAGANVRVHHVSDYYPGRGDAIAAANGMSQEAIGSHAGSQDTTSLMYINTGMLRFDKFALGKANDGQGHVGDPRYSTAVVGKLILEAQVEDAVKQDREPSGRRPEVRARVLGAGSRVLSRSPNPEPRTGTLNLEPGTLNPQRVPAEPGSNPRAPSRRCNGIGGHRGRQDAEPDQLWTELVANVHRVRRRVFQGPATLSDRVLGPPAHAGRRVSFSAF